MHNPALNPAILLSPVESGYVAYDTASDRLHELNPIAALIVELCNGARSVEAIRDMVRPLLPEGSDVEIDHWIDQGIQAGLLTWSNGSPAEHRELSPQEFVKLAKRLRNRGNIQTAFICLRKATELTPNDSDLWWDLGDVAQSLGRRDEARAYYEKYLELEPDDAEIKHIVVALRDEPPPTRVPDECIQQIYKHFSPYFDKQLCDDLSYKGPEHIEELVASMIGTDRSVAALELGCGTGLVGARIKPLASSMIGLDLSPEMIELARARNIYDRLEVAEMSEWLARDQGSFDLIVAADCLIYFADLRQVVVPAARLLNEGGLLVFTLERGDRYPFHLADTGRYTHHPDHVREAAAEAGLSVARLEERYLRMEYGAEVTGLFVALRNESPGLQD